MNSTHSYSNEDKVKKDIIKSTKAIRLKHKKLKLSEAQFNQDFKKTFKPIVDPLNKLVSSKKTVLKKEENYDEEDQDSGASGRKEEEEAPHVGVYALRYVSLHHDPRNAKQLDKVYGIRKHGKHLFLGNSLVTIARDVIHIGDEKYAATPGLLELLFMKQPDSSIYTQEDLEMYKTLVEQTSAHRQKYDSTRQANSNRGFKYVHIIKPLFLTKKKTSGSGMKIDKPRYEYWDDPNELVARLRLLLSSQSAGNNSHQNEILSIVEELREANIIE
jgi:hypothetical protein